MRDHCINEAGEFIYSTYLPPASAAAAMAAIELVQKHPEWRTTARMKAQALRTKLRAKGWNILGEESAIMPVICGTSEATLRLADVFLQNGIRVGAIRPPTVPRGQARLRVSLKSTLSDQEYAKIYECLAENAPNHG